MAKAPHPFDNAYLLLTLTALFWAGNAIAGKLAAGVIPPFTLTFLRWVATAAVLYAFARSQIGAHRRTIADNRGRLFLFGAIGFALFNCSLYAALNFTTAINVAIEQSAMPAVIMLGMVLVYRERLTPLQLGGALVSILGVAVTVTQGDIARLARLDVNVGDAIMMLGVVAYAAYSVALRTKPDLPWPVFMFALSVAASIASAPLAALELVLGRHPEMSWLALALLVYVVVFPSLLAQAFFLRGVELIGASRAGLFINLVPVIAAGLAVAVLGEVFQAHHALGLGLVIGGIWIAERSARRASAKNRGAAKISS